MEQDDDLLILRRNRTVIVSELRFGRSNCPCQFSAATALILVANISIKKQAFDLDLTLLLFEYDNQMEERKARVVRSGNFASLGLSKSNVEFSVCVKKMDQDRKVACTLRHRREETYEPRSRNSIECVILGQY